MWRLRRTPSLQRLESAVASLVPGVSSSQGAANGAEKTSDTSGAMASWLATRSAGSSSSSKAQPKNDVQGDMNTNKASASASRGIRGLQERAQARSCERALLEVVYGPSMPDAQLFLALDACPEFGWLAECAYRCPLPPGWQEIPSSGAKGESKKKFILDASGETSSAPPRLTEFAKLASYIALARQSSADAEKAAQWIRVAAHEWMCEVQNLRQIWSGPFVDVNHGREYFYCNATGVSSWDNPCSTSAYLAFVAENLLQSDVFDKAARATVDSTPIYAEVGIALAEVGLMRPPQPNAKSRSKQSSGKVHLGPMDNLKEASAEHSDQAPATREEWDDMMNYFKAERREKSKSSMSVSSSQYASENEGSVRESERPRRRKKHTPTFKSSVASSNGSDSETGSERGSALRRSVRRLPALQASVGSPTPKFGDIARVGSPSSKFGDDAPSPISLPSDGSGDDDEFAAELDGLKGTVARLEAQVAALQKGISQQPATTETRKHRVSFTEQDTSSGGARTHLGANTETKAACEDEVNASTTADETSGQFNASVGSGSESEDEVVSFRVPHSDTSGSKFAEKRRVSVPFDTSELKFAEKLLSTVERSEFAQKEMERDGMVVRSDGPFDKGAAGQDGPLSSSAIQEKLPRTKSRMRKELEDIIARATQTADLRDEKDVDEADIKAILGKATLQEILDSNVDSSDDEEIANFQGSLPAKNGPPFPPKAEANQMQKPDPAKAKTVVGDADEISPAGFTLGESDITATGSDHQDIARGAQLTLPIATRSDGNKSAARSRSKSSGSQSSARSPNTVSGIGAPSALELGVSTQPTSDADVYQQIMLPAVPTATSAGSAAFVPTTRNKVAVTTTPAASVLPSTSSSSRKIKRLPPAPGAAPRTELTRRSSAGNLIERPTKDCVGVTAHWVGLGDAGLGATRVADQG